jgi:hypothetical protein
LAPQVTISGLSDVVDDYVLLAAAWTLGEGVRQRRVHAAELEDRRRRRHLTPPGPDYSPGRKASVDLSEPASPPPPRRALPGHHASKFVPETQDLGSEADAAVETN